MYVEGVSSQKSYQDGVWSIYWLTHCLQSFSDNQYNRKNQYNEDQIFEKSTLSPSESLTSVPHNSKILTCV